METKQRIETIVKESMMVEHSFHKQMLNLFPDFCDISDVRMMDTYLPRIIEYLSQAHTIIDIGSGTSKLALELETYGIHCIPVEPRWAVWTMSDKEIQVSYSNKAQLEIERKNLAYQTREKYDQAISNNVHRRTVAADVLQLPFQDNSVDIAMSHIALPMYLKTVVDMKNFFLELKRVLCKETGEARLYPFNQNYLKLVKAMLDTDFVYNLLPTGKMVTLVAKSK